MHTHTYQALLVLNGIELEDQPGLKRKGAGRFGEDRNKKQDNTTIYPFSFCHRVVAVEGDLVWFGWLLGARGVDIHFFNID